MELIHLCLRASIMIKTQQAILLYSVTRSFILNIGTVDYFESITYRLTSSYKYFCGYQFVLIHV